MRIELQNLVEGPITVAKKKNAEPGEMSRLAASHLDLRCLMVSHLNDTSTRNT